VSRLSRQCGILNISLPYRPARPVKRIALIFFFTFYFTLLYASKIIYFRLLLDYGAVVNFIFVCMCLIALCCVCVCVCVCVAVPQYCIMRRGKKLSVNINVTTKLNRDARRGYTLCNRKLLFHILVR
jgi:hypothetical protein